MLRYLLPLLPFLCFLVLMMIIWRKRYEVREAFVYSSVIIGFLFAFITEALSLFNVINFLSILIFWLTALICFTIILIKNTKHKIKLPKIKFNSIQKIILFGILFILATTFIIAFSYPPNNSDSMIYHMARIPHWIQNKNINFYPTNIERQLFSNPFAEYVILHLQILSRNDRFSNLVQWFSMLGSVIVASLLAKKMGAKKNGQILASVLVATIPMGILQSTSTQNDYVVAYWLLCFVYFIVCELMNKEKIKMQSMAFLGISLGLALLTKGTAYFYALPFLFWLILAKIQTNRKNLKPLLKPLLVLVIFIILINSAYYIRNMDIYGTPVYNYPYLKNEVYSVKYLISNIIRNTVLHLGSCNRTPFRQISSFIDNALLISHKCLGVDINSPQTTFSWEKFRWVKTILTHEDTANNPFHLVLIILMMMLLFKLEKNKNRLLLNYIASIVFAFAIFCFIIKWMPWNSRLHLPLLVLISPVMGIIFVKNLGRKSVYAIMIFSLLLSSPWVLYNRTRPLAGIFGQEERNELYFSVHMELKTQYVNATNIIKNKGCTRIGLDFRSYDWEYPLWTIVSDNNKKEVRIEHINVNNPSIKKINEYYQNFVPCAILSTRNNNSTMVFKDVLYVNYYRPNSLNTFVLNGTILY